MSLEPVAVAECIGWNPVARSVFERAPELRFVLVRSHAQDHGLTGKVEALEADARGIYYAGNRIVLVVERNPHDHLERRRVAEPLEHLAHIGPEAFEVIAVGGPCVDDSQTRLPR